MGAVKIFSVWDNSDNCSKYGAKIGQKIIVPPIYNKLEYFTEQRNLEVFIASRKPTFFYRAEKVLAGEFGVLSLKNKILVDFGATQINKSVETEGQKHFIFDREGFAIWAKKQPNVSSERIDSIIRIIEWKDDIKHLNF
jgi:hypothetical protein